jgi:hypothetical protein
MIDRRVNEDGSIRLSAAGCSYEVRKLRPHVIFLAIEGRETGQLGRAPLGEVAAEAALEPPLHLLIDMSALTHVSEAVSNDWTAWFQANQQAVRRVDVLAPEPFVRLVVAVSQVFSRTGNLIQIHTKADKFAVVLAEFAPEYAWRTATPPAS